MANRLEIENIGNLEEIRKKVTSLMIHVLCSQVFHRSFTSYKEIFEGTCLCDRSGESYQFDIKEGQQLAIVANDVIAEWDCEEMLEVVVREFEEEWMAEEREYENNPSLPLQCFLHFQRCK